ncbi:hypothetical protein [Alkalihalobacillus deserti]|uniref:hypothetical protein n=1 Tax=Alkalihalobacillus deserti TaxID=2879466 RepID=UPI001D147CD3|nr:hypothetical protein [Alkalihalobacillus deserti]
MNYDVFSFLVWTSIIGFLLFLIIGIVVFVKNKRRSAIKWFGFMIGCLIFFIALFQFVYPEELLVVDHSTGESELTDSSEENKIKLDSNSFNISLKTTEYDSEENSLHIEYETGLPDGTVVEIARFSPSLPDSWGEKYNPFSFSYTYRLIPRGVETTVKDGLISFSFDNYDFNDLLFLNSLLFTTINIYSTDEINPFIKEEFSTADEFNETTSELKKKMKENGKEIFASDNEDGLEIKFFDKYEMKNAHSIDDIYAYYNKESIPYKELEKNPSKYEGTPISFTGKILQIQTEEVDNPEYNMLDNYSVIRLAVNGDLDQVVFVTVQDINGMEGIVSDDTITVYGELTRSTTYESVAGYKITLPSIDAVIYEK